MNMKMNQPRWSIASTLLALSVCAFGCEVDVPVDGPEADRNDSAEGARDEARPSGADMCAKGCEAMGYSDDVCEARCNKDPRKPGSDNGYAWKKTGKDHGDRDPWGGKGKDKDDWGKKGKDKDDWGKKGKDKDDWGKKGKDKDDEDKDPVKTCFEQCFKKGADPATCKKICLDGGKKDDKKPPKKDPPKKDPPKKAPQQDVYACYKKCVAAGKDASNCKKYCYEQTKKKDPPKKDPAPDAMMACFKKCVAAKGEKAAADCKKYCYEQTKKKDPPKKDPPKADEQAMCFKKCVSSGADAGKCKDKCYGAPSKQPPKKDPTKDAIMACYNKCVATKGKKAAPECKKYCTEAATKGSDKKGSDKGPSAQDFCYKGCTAAGYKPEYCKPKCYGK